MKIFKIAPLIILLLITSDCEKTESFYYPRSECGSDWLTNAYYHQQVDKVPEITNSPDAFTATINGTPFSGTSFVKASYYKERISVWTSNGDYYISLDLEENGNGSSQIELNLNKYTAYSRKLLEKTITLTDLDPVNGTVSIEFSARFEVHTYTPTVFDGDIVIENGKIQNVKFMQLFCRPDYTLSNADSILYGTWNLIEITDCNTNSVYYPPCYCLFTNPLIDIDTAKRAFTDEYLIYDYDLRAWEVNECSMSYKFLNDTTIVTSGGGATQVGSTIYELDYESLFFSLITKDTITIKLNKNLLELKTSENVLLRFYK
jgi:hypothetical protein